MGSRETVELSDVFGISRGIPLTYVRRREVDDSFVNNLARGRHIVVFGASKQGKTCLRRQWLEDEQYILVQCSTGQSREAVYELLLKRAGAKVSVTDKKTVKGTYKINVEFYSGEVAEQTETASTSLELDPADCNDVIRALSDLSFSKHIVLEDFHYLEEKVQRELAFDLKAFHEQSSIIMIVVGVWLETNRLILYNGDLAGRLIPIDADGWSPDDLGRVIAIGEDLLNFRFPPNVRDALVLGCGGNVGLLQEACSRICANGGVVTTQDLCKSIGSLEQVEQVLGDVADEHAARYRNYLALVCDGDSVEAGRRLVIRAILEAPRAKRISGLRVQELGDVVGSVEDARQAVTQLIEIQQQNQVKPIILDWDAGENVLRIVDGGFQLFLDFQKREHLLAAAGLD